ncbi:uncharacterized protein LOC125683312 [Ostrea edulis]|uniref:uncharacterized protein LOC125683312 n=1 Tax=Ostrea edulis TaxID=37623 RepID=UPI0024AEB1C0|nr:uncharacterized protein LOC125683312 [Ostrea edulis]
MTSLPRCGSLFAFGTEDKHLEIRARIVHHTSDVSRGPCLPNYLFCIACRSYEIDHCSLSSPCMVKYKELYIDANHFKDDSYRTNNEALTFAMFSEFFNDEILTLLAVQRIFEKEAFAVKKSGSFMGAWQIAALANVLGRPIRSIYPLYGGQTVRKYLNRTFLPFDGEAKRKPAACVMWTNMQGNATPETQWRPNHFVAVLPLEPQRHNVLSVVDPLHDIHVDLMGLENNMPHSEVAFEEYPSTESLDISAIISNLDEDLSDMSPTYPLILDTDNSQQPERRLMVGHG